MKGSKRMPDDVTKVAGLPIPSIRRSFCGWLASRYGRPHLRGGRHCRDGQRKCRGGHSTLGTLYYWSLFAVFCVRHHSRGDPMGRRLPPVYSRGTFIRGSVLGPHPSPTKREPVGPVSHKNLPVWKELPSVTYWLLPGGIGMPIIVRAVQGTPPVRRADPQHTTMAE